MQAGQNNLHITDYIQCEIVKKKILEFRVKFGLLIILFCSLGKSCQRLGKLYKGNKSRDVKFACVRRSWSKLPSWI